MQSDSLAPDHRSFRTFGWQGINLTIPANWDLIYTRGQYASGSLQLADESTVRMDVRWETGGRKSPAALVDAYLADAQKAGKKRGADVSIQRSLNLASPVGKEAECYRWVNGRQVLAMLSRCSECGRTVHVQLLGQPGDRLRGLARTVFGSLKDHADGDSHLWSFFDVEFRSPVGLPLVTSSLKTGCIRMAFGRRMLGLEFVRVSMAEHLLADTSLEAWFRRFYGKSLKRRSISVAPATVKGHPAIAVEGAPWMLCNPLRLVGRRRVLRAACWQCEPTNRLFICSYDGAAAEAGLYETALEGFRCCDSGGSASLAESA